MHLVFMYFGEATFNENRISQFLNNFANQKHVDEYDKSTRNILSTIDKILALDIQTIKSDVNWTLNLSCISVDIGMRGIEGRMNY